MRNGCDENEQCLVGAAGWSGAGCETKGRKLFLVWSFYFILDEENRSQKLLSLWLSKYLLSSFLSSIL